MKYSKTTFTPEEMKAFEPTEKIGIVATVNDNGQPHISLITTMAAQSNKKLLLGEFSKGLSKGYMQTNNKVAFLMISLDKKYIRGKAQWTHLSTEGPEYEMFNNKPMFRYNTYFGINTVHYLDVIETNELKSLPLGKIIIGALKTKAAKGGMKTGAQTPILKPLAENLFNDISSLSFLSYICKDGFPAIIPIIQCQAADSTRLAFSLTPFGDEIFEIQEGAEIAIFGLTMSMVNVLVRGKFRGINRTRGIKTGSLDIEWVYNSLPPVHGQIYPEVKPEAVVNY